MLARLGGLYKVQGKDAEAVAAYEKLAKMHPQSEVLKMIGINMASALFEKGEFLEGAKALEEYTDISALDDRNLYYLIKKFAAADLKEHEQKAVSSIVLKCFKKLNVNGFAANEINKRHELEFIAARSMEISGKTSDALKLLNKIADEKPNGPWIIDIRLLIGKCHATEEDFTAVSENFGTLRKKAAAMNGGAGDLSLKLKIEVEWSGALANSKDPAHLKKGKALSFLAAQMNPLAINLKERYYLEKAHYLNVLYAKLTGQGDLKTMKTEFLKKYPATRFAAKVRKL
jgi:outer membrane protein assembly factor BamD (BamD/ComL family)